MWTPEAIRKLRRELGWTQLELGSYLGVGKTAACNWERGRCPPSRLAADGLSALADVVLRLKRERQGGSGSALRFRRSVVSS